MKTKELLEVMRQGASTHVLQSHSGLSTVRPKTKTLTPHPDGKTIRRPK